MTPAWILDIFAAVMLAVAALSVARIAAAWPWRRGAVVNETDIAYPLMGVAMAGTLTVGLRTLPDGAWDVIFAVLTAWFGYRVVRDARASGGRPLAGLLRAPQRVQSAAMLYMFLALAAPATGGGAGASGPAMRTLNHTTLAFAFAAVLATCSVWDLDQLSGARYSLARGFLLSPEISVGCRIAMGVTMSFMLLIMI